MLSYLTEHDVGGALHAQFASLCTQKVRARSPCMPTVRNICMGHRPADPSSLLQKLLRTSQEVLRRRLLGDEPGSPDRSRPTYATPAPPGHLPRPKPDGGEWNYQFIADAFASDDTTSSEGSLNLDIELVEVKRTRYSMRDLERKKAMSLYSGLIRGNIESADFNENSFNINSLLIDNTHFMQEVLKKPKVVEAIEDISESVVADTGLIEFDFDEMFGETIDTTDWGVEIRMKALDITGSSFRFRNHNQEKGAQKMDFSDMWFQDIALDLDDLVVTGDSLTGNIVKLSSREHSGFELKEMSAKVIVDDEKMAFDRLDLNTANSRITDYYEMGYDHFSDFNDYVNKIRMKADFRGTSISGKDLAYFIPDFDSEEEEFNITGEISGKVTRLKGDALDVNFGEATIFQGELVLNDIIDPEVMFMQLRVDDFYSTRADLPILLQDIKMPENIAMLGLMNFKGEFIGFLSDFVAYGTLNSRLGKVITDINMKIPEETGIANYSGSVETVDFDIGQFLKIPDMSRISMSTSIKGTGLKKDQVNISTDGKITELIYNDYRYTDLKVDGNLARNAFEGNLISKDPNCDLIFEGTIDFADRIPYFKSKAEIHSLNFGALNFTSDTIVLNGLLDADLRASNLDNALGYAILKGASLETKWKVYPIDSLYVSMTQVDSIREFRTAAEFVTLTLKGEFLPSEIPANFTNIVNHYYPDFPVAQKPLRKANRLDFNLDVNDKNNIIGLLVDGLDKGIVNTKGNGYLNAGSRQFELSLSSPGVSYNYYQIDSIEISSETGQDEIIMTLEIDKISEDEMVFTDIILVNNLEPGELNFDLSVEPDSAESRARVKGQLKTIGNRFQLTIPNSELVIENKLWNLAPGNMISWEKKNIIAQNVILSREEQKIMVSTPQSGEYNSHFKVILENANIRELLGMAGMSQVGTSGIMTGSVDLYNVFDEIKFESDLFISDFALDENLIGDSKLKVIKIDRRDAIEYDITLGNPMFNGLYLSGDYFYRTKDLTGKILAKDFSLAFAERFLQGEITDLDGIINARGIEITGDLDAPVLNGEMDVTDLKFTVNYLKVPYEIPELHVKIDDDEFSFTDKLYPINVAGRKDLKGNFKGAVRHEQFSNFRIDRFGLFADSFLLMNTTEKDNKYFYGRAMVSPTYMSIDGPFSNLNISGYGKTIASSSLTIPIDWSKDTRQYDFINFVDLSDPNTDVDGFDYQNRITIDLEIDITPEALASIIIDQSMGDGIRARGTGNLALSIDYVGNMVLVGNYEIESGKYLFSFEDIFTKEFDIESGSTISWSGDPMAATLDVDATYPTQTTKWDLISPYSEEMSSDEIKTAKQKMDVTVLLTLQGLLESPDLDFDIVLDNETGLGDVFTREFNLIKSDPNELNKQVFALLVMNRFLPAGQGSTFASIGSSSVNSTVTEFLSSQLSSYFGEIISRFDEGLEIDINYSRYSQTNGTTDGTRNDLEVAISRRLLKDRVEVNVGGNVDFGQTGSTENNYIAGDFEVVYSITPDGRLKVNAFRKSEYDILKESNVGKTGVGVSFRTRFNNWWELWKRKK